MLLGGVHGDVGAPQQRLGVIAVLRVPRDADAGVDLERDLVEHHRLADAAQSTSSTICTERDHVVAATRRQDRELVTAEARHQAAVADPRRQPRPEVSQQVIPELVAERVVDVLEVVEVEQHHAERRVPVSSAAAISASSRSLNSLAVGESGQFVGGRHHPQLLAAALGDQQLAARGTGRPPARARTATRPADAYRCWSCRRRPASAPRRTSSAAIDRLELSQLSSDRDAARSGTRSRRPSRS